MKRKMIVLLISIMVIAVAMGCGDDEAVPAVDVTTPTAGEESSKVEEIPAAEEVVPAEETEAPVVLGDLITVGVINSDPDESSYHTAIDKDLQDTFTRDNGYSASFVYDSKNSGQIAAAQKFIQDGVDYLLISAVDASGWDSVLMDAQDAGVRVILFDRIIDVDENLYEASIVSDIDKEGENAVNWLKDQGLSEYNIIHLQGDMGSAEQEGRTGALDIKVAEDGNWNFVIQQTAEGNVDAARRIVQSVIDSGRSFNVIYAENDDMAKGAVEALDEADISHGAGKEVIIVSFGCNKWALKEVLAQNWNYEGQCNPFQAFCIDAVIKIIESGDAIAEKVILMDEKSFDADTITAEDIEIYGI